MPTNEELFLEKLKEIEPNLYKIHQFFLTASNIFGHGEAEIRVIIHCSNYHDKRMILEAQPVTGPDRRIKESYSLT